MSLRVPEPRAEERVLQLVPRRRLRLVLPDDPLVVLFMLAAETEAAGVLQLSTYVRGLTVPNEKAASE